MKTVRVHGACLTGTRAELVTVEARFEDAEQGRTEVQLSGLPDPVIRESRARLLSALSETGFFLPAGRLTLNLVPAGRRKAGELLDLPLAIGAAAAIGHLDPRGLRGTLFLGELGIDGALHAGPGALAAAELARAEELARLVAPEHSARQAAYVRGVSVYGCRDLAQVAGLLAGARTCRPLEPTEPDAPPPSSLDHLAAVRGQAVGVEAVTVAAAGGHSLLFVGPPGTGKSLLARALVDLLPAPTLRERLELTTVACAAGAPGGELASRRPFRAPHHTTSHAGLVGGGSPPRPGEITLAHLGVLFLDELPEFKRDVLECLRQPLEEGFVALARAGAQVELPARFQLVTAMNPCPCGYRGHPRVPCRCSEREVRRYRQRISGPLLDRIDLCLELAPPELDALCGVDGGTPRSELEERVERVRRARERSLARGTGGPNRCLSGDALDEVAPLLPEARELVRRSSGRAELSARAVQSLRRVARTVADLDDHEEVEVEHYLRALALRAPPP